MTEEEVKYLLREASEKIKEDFIPNMTNLLMDVFQHGINKGSELGMKVASDASKSKSQSLIKWQTGKPEEEGTYLVTLKVREDVVVTYNIYSYSEEWHYSNKVLAWCKLSDIKPFKDETK